MAHIKFLDERGVRKVITEIKKRATQAYQIKGSAIYADTDYLAGEHPVEIDAVGLWKLNSGAYEQVIAVEPGWVYNITNDFTIDSDFIEYDASDPKRLTAGINVVAVNTGTAAVPVMKWDLLAMGADLTPYQQKQLTSALAIYSNETPTVYTASANLPTTEAQATATITDGMIAILGAGSESGDVYVATVEANENDSTQNDITWTKLGNQTTVEGALELISNVTPNTPITEAEITAMFNGE